jgi:zinc transport system ATP-binding protein
VLFFGHPLKESWQQVGYVPQFANIDRSYPVTSMDVMLTALLGSGLHPFHRTRQADIDRARQTLDEVGLTELADRQIASLSGGEFQRLLIARSLARHPKLLLLDEPTASVDPASREQIYSLLAKLNGKGMTIILVSHDMMAISSQVKHLACISEHLIYHGNPEINEQIVEHMYGCPVDLIAHGVPHRVLPPHEHT